MKILWVSNHPMANTGYGNQTKLFCDCLLRAGHEIVIFAFWGQDGYTLHFPSGIKILPKLNDPFGNDIALTHYSIEKPDIVITLVNPLALSAVAYQQMPWITWCPVEGEPLRPDDAAVIRGAKRIWAMSHTAEPLFKAAGFSNVDYVPHGIDSSVFKPIDRTAARAEFAKASGIDLTDTYLVSYVAANKGMPSRKAFYEGMKAFKNFRDKTGSKAILYLHTTDRGDVLGGEELNVVRELAGLGAADIVYPHQYNYLTGQLPGTYLNMVYNASDVYFHPARGEGFGIPLVEAQMAGCPVVVNDYGTLGELCLTGWKAPYKAMHQWTIGQLQSLPDVDELTKALISSYEARGQREQLGKEARDKAMQFDHHAVFEKYMQPSIDRFAEQFLSKKVKRAAQRKAAREKAVGLPFVEVAHV